MAAQAQHAGNFAGAPLDDFDDEMLRLLGGVGEGLLAPETQLLGAGLAVGSSLKEEWMGGTTAVSDVDGRREYTCGAAAGALLNVSAPGANGKRRRDARAGSDDTALAPHALVPACTPGTLSVVELLGSVIAPAVAAFVGRQVVAQVPIAARAEPRAPMATFNVRGQLEVARLTGHLKVVATRYAAHMRQVSAALRTNGECSAPVWQLGNRVPPHAESALHALQLQAAALAAALNDGLSQSPRSYVAVLQRSLSSVENAHIADLQCLLGELHIFLSASQTLLAELRCRPGAAFTYVDVSAGILDLVAIIASSVQHHNMERVAEFAPRVADAVVWPTPYFEHARTLGSAHVIETLGNAE